MYEDSENALPMIFLDPSYLLISLEIQDNPELLKFTRVAYS